MITSDRPYGRREQITFHKGHIIETSQGNYRLKSDLTFDTLDWRGAFADIYVKDPLSGRVVCCGPNVDNEVTEPAVAASQVLKEAAEHYTRLSKMLSSLDTGDRRREEINKKVHNIGLVLESIAA